MNKKVIAILAGIIILSAVFSIYNSFGNFSAKGDKIYYKSYELMGTEIINKYPVIRIDAFVILRIMNDNALYLIIILSSIGIGLAIYGFQVILKQPIKARE